MAHVGRVGVGALAGLIAVDVILVALAIQHVRGDDDATAAPPPPTFAESEAADDPPTSETPAESEDEPTDEPSPEPTGVEVPSEPATADRTIVNMGSDDTVGRASTGTCGAGGGAVELSTDGGVEFAPADLPEEAEVILRLSVTNPDAAWLIATDADCETYTTYTTEDGGQTWESSEGSDGSWHLLNQTTVDLHGPYGTVTTSCADDGSVVDISMLSEGVAFALCSDGAVVATEDSGDTWTEPDEASPVPNAVSIDFVDESVGLLVAAGSEDCAGLAVYGSDDSGATWEPRSCIETTGSGLADVSTTGGSAYIVHDGDVWHSGDNGETWEERATAP